MGCAPLRNSTAEWISTPTGLGARQSAFESSFSVARAYEAQGNYRQAGEVYSKLISDGPQDHRLHHRLGVLAVREGRLDEANSQFDRALKAAPEDAELLTDIGYAFYLQGRYDDAEERLKRVVANNPDNKRAVNNLGMVLAKTGRGSEAYRVFRRTGSDAMAHSNLAYAYANNGQLDLAEKHYSRALDYDETLTQASDALLQLDELRRDLDAGAELVATAPMTTQPAEKSNGQRAIAQQSMEKPDSAEFAAKWRQNGVDGDKRKYDRKKFEFEDEFYGSNSTGVTSAVHDSIHSDSANHREILLLQIDELRRDLDAGAELVATAPMTTQPAEKSNGQRAIAQQSMEKPDSAEFAAKWRQNGVDGDKRKYDRKKFEFEDEFYGSNSTGVTSAVHDSIHSDSANHREILQTSRSGSLSRN